MKTLFTAVGFNDPFSAAGIEGEERAGVILTLLNSIQFEHVFLVTTKETRERAQKTAEIIGARHPGTQVDQVHLTMPDPTGYSAIMNELRQKILPLVKDDGSEYSVSVSSGTPQMHAAWLLLAASGELPADILNVRRPKYVAAKSLPVTRLNFESPEFPRISPNISIVRQEEAPFSRNHVAAVLADLGMVAESPKMSDLVTRLEILSSVNRPVLITGETGTGKELFARMVHLFSDRRAKELVVFNCGALPENLVESLLFGHRKGAFTGADRDCTGLFDQADGGTLFLDELGELPQPAQVKLLRALDRKEVHPLGAPKPHTVDVRFVAATNVDLKNMVQGGQFRKDLYYRLEGGLVQVPPLRLRGGDEIVRLAVHILAKVNREFRKARSFSRPALLKLRKYAWPGNVRELEHVIENAVLFSANDALQPRDIEFQPLSIEYDPIEMMPEPHEGFDLSGFLEEIRGHYWKRAHDLSNGNDQAAGRLLGMSGANFSKQKNKYLN